MLLFCLTCRKDTRREERALLPHRDGHVLFLCPRAYYSLPHCVIFRSLRNLFVVRLLMLLASLESPVKSKSPEASLLARHWKAENDKVLNFDVDVAWLSSLRKIAGTQQFLSPPVKDVMVASISTSSGTGDRAKRAINHCGIALRLADPPT